MCRPAARYPKKLRATIVYNETMWDLLSWHCETIHIIPKVDVSQFRFEPLYAQGPPGQEALS